ncbi:hypothetical protein EDC94DRAFT_587410 [Helicostylum pulchrum]|nr:hypothetical protein EDC94DRAFT_587410 [Helicostylum pulchrum]
MVGKIPSSSTGESSSSSMPPPQQPTYVLANSVKVVEPLKKYINFCKQKPEREGFFVRTDTHQLLDTISKEYKPQDKLDDDIHLKLTKIARIQFAKIISCTESSNPSSMKKTIAYANNGVGYTSRKRKIFVEKSWERSPNCNANRGRS